MTDRAGFRLIEMVAALAVFGLTALALLNLMGEGARSAARAETRLFGAVAAENLAVEAVLARDPPAPGTERGAVTLAGRDWGWVRRTVPTEDPALLRIEIMVSDAEGLAADLVVFRSAS